MTDEEIISLYMERSENAIAETKEKYGKLCMKIANAILKDERDSEECVNDTWLTLWNIIPPKKPNPMRAYVCRIAKNLSLKKYAFNHAEKRNSEYEVSLDELEECVHGRDLVEEQIVQSELTECINHFLAQLPKEKRVFFLRRYWYMDSVKNMAAAYHISEKNASMKLSRLRKQLGLYLEKEGYRV